MAFLVLGLVLFFSVHSIKIAAPRWRAGLVLGVGELPYKGLYAIVSAFGLGLIIWGFARAWENPVFLYSPPNWGRHVAMTLMIVASILAIAAYLPALWIRRFVAHPLLAATILWGIAHVFANGDLAGVVLFLAFVVWAAVDWLAQPSAATPANSGITFGKWDIAAILAGISLYVILIAGLHMWLFGVSPVV